MPLAAKEQIHPPLSQENEALHLPQEQGFGQRVHHLGKKALVTAGVVLALGGALHESPVRASTASQNYLAQDGTTPSPDNTDQPLPIADGAGPFEVGIATYNWSSENGHEMFPVMSELGMKVVRLNLVRESTKRDLSVIRHELPSAEANGIDTTVLLQQGSGKSEPGYAQWAANMALQLPQVHRFIIENEPNSKQFWTGTLQQYANQLHQAFVAMHEVRPDVIISGVGLDSIEANKPEAWLEHFMHYVTERFGSPHNVMDTLSVHLYRTPEQDEAMILQDEGLWDGLINIDEFGRIVKNVRAGYEPRGAATLSQQAQNIAQVITWAASNVQVQSIENYHLINPTSPNDLHTGLITPQGILMPSGYAVKNTLESFTPYVPSPVTATASFRPK